MTGKEIIWYRCDKCEQAFSNENEVSPANVNRSELGTSARYYFDNGTVWFSPQAPSGKALCYKCTEEN